MPSWYSGEEKRRSATVLISQFSPAGNAEQDDSVVWGGAAVAGASMFAQLAGAQLSYGMSHPARGGTQPLRDFPGSGVVYNDRLGDGPQRMMPRHWLRRMRAN